MIQKMSSDFIIIIILMRIDRIVTFVILLLILQVTPQQYSGVLSISWLAGFCQNQVQTHQEACDPSLTNLWDNQSHTIHGLWPSQVTSQNYGSFNISLFAKQLKLLDDMNNYWPPKIKQSSTDVFLWQHQWEVHGKDYAHIIYQLRPSDFPGTDDQRNGALQLTFFKDTISLYKSLKVQKLPGSSFSQGNYASQLGVSENNLEFTCFKESWIRQVHVCYDITKTGMVLSSCSKTNTNCINDASVIDFYDLSHKSQSRVFNYIKTQNLRRTTNNILSVE